MLTDQQIFDKVWQHFVVERGPWSVNRYGTCQYRGPRGQKCAVGVLIPDDMYQPSMERIEVGDLVFYHQFQAVVDYLDTTNERRAKLLQDLQKAHDEGPYEYTDASFTQAMQDRLMLIAHSYGLTVPA